MRITSQWLRKHEACADQVEIFAREWPKGVTVCLGVLKRAAELSLDLDWFARKALTAPALKAYIEATAPALKAYEEATAPAWKAYEKARAPAWKAYEEARAPALKAYKEARATALWKFLKKQEAD